MLRLGLITNAIGVADCVRFADAAVMRQQSVPDWILDLSLAASLTRAEVVQVLSRCGDPIAAEDVAGLYLGWLGRSLRMKRVSLAQASAFLSQMLGDPAADAHRGLICYLIDERDLAAYGAAQTPVFELAALFEEKLAPFERMPALADLVEMLEAAH